VEGAVLDAHQDRRRDAEPLAGAARLGRSRRGERLAGSDAGMGADALLPVGRDRQHDADALAGVAGQERRHDLLVVRMREHGQQRTGRRLGQHDVMQR
jgi:hypothetical protein